ncbi:hypothetical protein [uncultured Roseibium sp.]|uniref:hypothetical protein n=1 Tax=uncultured Roseibium sp. TaxID=1936171 RepID=UPI0032174643
MSDNLRGSGFIFLILVMPFLASCVGSDGDGLSSHRINTASAELASNDDINFIRQVSALGINPYLQTFTCLIFDGSNQKRYSFIGYNFMKDDSSYKIYRSEFPEFAFENDAEYISMISSKGQKYFDIQRDLDKECVRRITKFGDLYKAYMLDIRSGSKTSYLFRPQSASKEKRDAEKLKASLPSLLNVIDNGYNLLGATIKFRKIPSASKNSKLARNRSADNDIPSDSTSNVKPAGDSFYKEGVEPSVEKDEIERIRRAKKLGYF